MASERRLRFILRVLRIVIDVLEFEVDQKINNERNRMYYERMDEEPIEGQDDYWDH